MTNAEKLSNALQCLSAEERPVVAKLLRQIAHDVQSPLSTLVMEVFSIRMLLGQLEPANTSVTSERGPQLLANLSAISANMDRASNQLAEYINLLASFSASEATSPEGHDPDHSDRR